MLNKRTWIVLGASSLVSREFIKFATHYGHDLILLGRNEKDLEYTKDDCLARYPTLSVLTQKFDAQKPEEFSKIAQFCLENVKTPFSIFSALGRTDPETGEAADEDEFANSLDLFQVNYLAVIRFISLFVPAFKEQKKGEIIVLSTGILGKESFKNSSFCASKAALNIWLEGLRQKLVPYSVFVTTVMAGYLDTRQSWGDKNAFLVTSPADCAKAAWMAAKNKKAVACIPGIWRYFLWLWNLVPFIKKCGL